RNLEPAGNIFLVDRAGELAEKLDQALRPKLRILQKGVPVPRPGLGAAGVPISFVTDEERGKPNLVWSPSLKPGLYELLVYRSRHTLEPRAGDCLQLQLGRDGNKVVFKRGLLGDEKVARGRPHKEEGDWRLIVLHNQLVRPLSRPIPALQMTVGLEDYRN